MTSDLSHERCSEKLLAYARNELGENDAAEVTNHIQSCAECRSELAGLSAMLEPEVDRLTEAERSRLHRGIKAALERSAEPVAPVVSMDARREQRWGRRAFQALGVAAALAIIAVGVGSLFSGSDQLGDAGGDQAAEGGGGGGTAPAELPGPSPRFSRHQLTAEGAESAAGGDQSRTQEDKEHLFALSNKDLSRRGLLTRLGRDPLLSRFARAYDADDATELGPAFVEALASGAGDARQEVADCTQNLIDQSTGPIVPVFGSFTRFEKQDALVVGFIYTDRETGPLDRYSIWVWRRGACDTPLATAAGAVS